MSSIILLCSVLTFQSEPPKKPVPPDNPPRLSAAAFDEDDVAGHPDGDPPPLPSQVDWSLKKAQIAANPKRQRLSLAGLWRFAAMHAKDVSPQRPEMGWLKMPAGAVAQWEITDKRMKSTGDKWNGKLVGEHNCCWAERVVDAPVEWVRFQVYLVIKGSWADSDVFVAFQPLDGLKRDNGERWIEITESLVYGGEAPIALRLNAPGEINSTNGDNGAPSIRLELLPIGPRFDGMRVLQDPAKGELEVQFDLRRPKFLLGLPVRLSEIPLIVQFSYETSTGDAIYRFDQNIGPMPEESRSVSLRLPWSKGGQTPPDKAILRARLTSVYAGNMDLEYPLNFSPTRLEQAQPPESN
jgi:hypothetical protein